jgi:3-hydroxyisobutyrate dehydrogenase/2-hydroxy-3-oxopropionate reductase
MAAPVTVSTEPGTVAVVGCGRMGAAMARRLATAGVRLAVHNRTRTTAEAVARDTGAIVAATPAEAAALADTCVVSLADDAAVLATYRGADGLVAGLRDGHVVCDTSTVSPETVRALAGEVAGAGATLLDCPVSGSVPAVEAGTLVVMAGGDAEALERARPVLDVLATDVFHTGGTGSGAATKLVVNSLLHAFNVALSEALVLAERAGLDRETTYDVVASGAVGAPFVRYKRDAFLHPDTAAVAFSLDLAAKDLDLAHGLASAVGARTDQADANRRLVDEAVSAGMGARDLSAVADFLRRQRP